MARKSASQAKVKKVEFDKALPPIEEVFDDAKAMFVLTVETQVKTAKRVDNLLNLRDLSRNFWGDRFDDKRRSLPYLRHLQSVSIETYEQVLEAVKTFDLEDFRKEEIKDYFEDIVPDTAEIATEDDLLEATIKFLSVQPYGGKLIQLHQLIKDELRKRGE